MDVVIKWEEYETEFGGDPVTMELRPLQRPAMLLLMPYISEATSRPGPADPMNLKDGELIEVVMDSYKVQGLVMNIFPEHMKNLEGLTVNKEPVTCQMLQDEIILNPLVVDIMTKLMNISQLSKEDQKNLSSPSDQEGPESQS